MGGLVDERLVTLAITLRRFVYSFLIGSAPTVHPKESTPVWTLKCQGLQGGAVECLAMLSRTTRSRNMY